VTFNQYITAIQIDFLAYVVDRSTYLRRRGMQSQPSRWEVAKLILLVSMYNLVLRYVEHGVNNAYSDSDIDVFVSQINIILGTSYEITWSMDVWDDDENGGIWDDNANDGIWDDIHSPY